MGMIRIKKNHDALLTFGRGTYLRNNIRCHAGTLQHRDAFRHRVFQDRLFVMFTDIDINAEYMRIRISSAGSIELQH